MDRQKNLIPKYMKKNLLKIVTLAGLLSAFNTSAQTQYSNEFWISTNATGNIYPSGGTLDNPLDGSTEVTFTTNMWQLPPNSKIHLLPGLFRSNPASYGWVKTGDKIIGSGIDVTIVQLDSAAHDGMAVFNYYNNGNCYNTEISDLTVDANSAPPSIGHHGISIKGSENAIRRVKAINNYGPGTEEIVAIALDNYDLPDSTGNIIEDCVVTNYLGGVVDGICFNGGYPTQRISGIMRNNHVYFPPVEATSLYPVSIGYVHSTLIEGNYLNGGQVQIHCDTGGFYDTIIAHNFFLNCLNAVAPYTVGTNEDHITIAFNNIDLIWTNNYSSRAFDFWGGTQTDIKIIGNTIQTSGSGSGDGAYIMNANNLTGLEFADNSVDSLLASNQLNVGVLYTNVVNATIDNNYDLYGNYLYDLNVPTLGGVAVSPLSVLLLNNIRAGTTNTTTSPVFVKFSTPVPDTNYVVTLSIDSKGYAWCYGKTTNGFTAGTVPPSALLNYTAVPNQ
jgi:hypothetical protein